MTSQQIICAASSSSSSSLVSSKNKDVFLSFRGEDTRRTFISHLYEALVRKNLKTFIDDNELQKGDDISPSLTKAIEESYISIVIFSKHYASSKWCLNELIKILECKNDWGQIVIPVFYYIDPSHVRHQTDSYQEAFAKHEGDMKLNKDILQKWKYALFEASNLVGFDSSKYKSDAVLVKDIVEDVLRKLKPRHPLIIKERGLVGIEQKYKKMISLLEMGSNDVRSIGVWGMGGSGKTTLVQVLFDELFPQFEGYCFLNVREVSQMSGLDAVTNTLFSTLAGEKNVRPNAPRLEIQSIMRRLLGKKLLIVLDDVTTSNQMECLTQYNHVLGNGSRVIVTTRDKDIINDFHAIYKVNELNQCDSLELFCLKAFREKHPNIGFEELSKSVIFYCKGNPLALEVLGRCLYSKTKEEWKCVFKKLQKLPYKDIHSVLKLSYDDLDPSEKNIFLDIACFLRGKQNINTIKSLLEAYEFHPVSGLKNLEDKALITIEYNKIQMHDLIQDMGWKIVNQIEEPGKRSRLWECEEVADVLKNNKGTKVVEGIRLNTYELGEDLSLSSDCFKRMTNLRYLEINADYECKVYLPDGLEWLSDKLRYLEWDRFPLESLPSTFCANMLVELKMRYSKLKKLWDGVQNLFNLKKIDINYSKDLNKMPDLSRATNLEIVNLENCSSLCELHPSVLSLPKLEELYLQDCTKIKSLKSNIHSKSLSTLDLQGCSSLMEFSVTSEEMTFLNLTSTAIRELPSSIWRNSKLDILSISGCKELSIVEKKLSNDPGIVYLKYLDLSGCTQMDALNLSFLLDGIQSLKWLYLKNCCNLETLPHNIHKHTELDTLWLVNCINLVLSSPTELLPPSLTCLSLERTAIRELPSSIWRLEKLEELHLSGCEELSIVEKKLSNDPGIVSLRKLNLSKCTKMDALNLSFLLDGIQSLEELRLTGCCNLETLPPNIDKHTKLERLNAFNCTLMDTNSTQRLLLDNMLQSIFLNRLEEEQYEYFLLMPGDQVPVKFEFTGVNSVTIPHIPKSNLKGFLLCFVFSKGMKLFDISHFLFCNFNLSEELELIGCYIHEDFISLNETLISDHVLVFRCPNDDFLELGRSEGDLLYIEFGSQSESENESESESDGGQYSIKRMIKGIKGVGVLPLRRVEIVELESEASDVELESQACDVDEFDDQQQPPKKKMRA